MFLIFSLRHPNVLPVGDVGVQKELLRWALAAHGALPKGPPRESKVVDARKARYRRSETGGSKPVIDRLDEEREGEIDMRVRTTPPEPKLSSAACLRQYRPNPEAQDQDGCIALSKPSFKSARRDCYNV